MGIINLLCVVIISSLSFVVAMIIGMTKEQKRIQNIFRIKEGYSYSEFYDILEDFEEEERERENLDRFLKSRKRK
jgi:hypothetical protein